MSVCERCTENGNCAWQNHDETICREKPAFHITNADRIRAMTDEELAEAFATACPEDTTVSRCCQYFAEGSRGCHDCWLDWLKQEASE